MKKIWISLFSFFIFLSILGIHIGTRYKVHKMVDISVSVGLLNSIISILYFRKKQKVSLKYKENPPSK